MTRDKFLGKANDCKGKEGSNDHRDDGADEGDEVGCGMRVIRYDFGDMVAHLYTFLGPDDTEEYPRPNQHDDDGKK